ncbi:MAG: hypothetical protein CME71_05665 [Halobacteriovorax sp.]|nr:hypothetical protein [Halobacteriovorax sp.]
MIELVDIQKTFKKDLFKSRFEALKKVSFSVNDGDICGFLGANGAGKTTSIKIILNFIQSDSGQVRYSNKFGSSYKQFIKNLGYLPERPYFHANLTGQDFVEYMAKLHDMKRPDYRAQIKHWGERLGIDHALDRKLHNYSKGMLQRIGFVACLVHDPNFLILDEPVSGLDPVGRKEIKDVMVELNKAGKTIFFSSHIVSDIEEICSSLIVLDKGSMIYDGKVSDLLVSRSSGLCEVIYKVSDSDQFKSLGDIISLADGYSKIIIKKENRNELLAALSSQKGELVRFLEVNPTLEDIVYQTNKRI